jgi:hypothetical protein
MQEDKFHIQSFEKGMNQDLNLENSNGTYLYAKNFRINSTKSNKLLGLTNDIKNSLLTQLPEGHIIIGSGLIRDTVVLFTTLSTDETGGTGWIWTFNVDKDTMVASTLLLKYTNIDLRFSSKYPIECIAIYENENTQRIYFSDYFNKTRSVNLSTLNLSDDIEALSMFVDVTTKAPVVKEISSGGSLPVGIYEYFTYLVTPDGKETLYSPNSIQIHLVESLESVSNSSAYFGSYSLDSNNDNINTGKAVKLEIDLTTVPTGLFQKVVLCVLYKSELINVPTIFKVEEQLLNNNQYVTITHSNNELSASIISYENYATNNNFPFYTNKTFAVKDNNLVISNIKTKRLDLKWDTQCFRHKQEGVFPYTIIAHEPYKNYFNDESGKAYGDRPLGTYNDWYTNDQYKYQADGVTLGGESSDSSVKYEFTLEPIVLEPYNNDNYFVQNLGENSLTFNGHTIENSPFKSYHSPQLRILKGYKREEIYRFGLIGKKGNSVSFVKYIGDIKFPSISEPIVNYYRHCFWIYRISNISRVWRINSNVCFGNSI